MDRRQTLFLEGPMLRALVTLAVPITLGNILQTGYQLTDAFWVGRLGAASVAAISVSFPVMFLVIALGSGLGMAGATLTAQYMGAGRQDQVDYVAAQTLVLVAISSVILGGIGYVLVPYLLVLLGVAPAVYRAALGFMHVSFIGVIFVFLFSMFQALLRGVGQTRIPLYIVGATVLLNFALDPLLIFGYGPVPGYGVVGSALATLICQGVAALTGLVILRRGRHGIKLHWRALVPDMAYLKRAFFLGFPASIEMATRALGLMMMSFLVVGFGTETIAAYGVGSTILQVVTIPAMGFSMAVATLAGQNMGAGNPKRAKRATVLGALAGFVFLTVAGLVAFAAAPALVRFFIPADAGVIAGGASFIRVMCLAWGFIGVQFCLNAAFRASGNMLMAMVMALVAQWMIQFPLAFVLSHQTALGARGLWWSFPVTNVLTAGISLAWFARGGWMRKRLVGDARLEEEVTEAVIIEGGMR